MKPTFAQGYALDAIARHYGIKRRFFGFEPDWMLRRRVWDAVAPKRRKIDWLAVTGWALVGVLSVCLTLVAFVYAMLEPIL